MKACCLVFIIHNHFVHNIKCSVKIPFSMWGGKYKFCLLPKFPPDLDLLNISPLKVFNLIFKTDHILP